MPRATSNWGSLPLPPLDSSCLLGAPGPPNVTLKRKIVTASVRIGGWWSSQRTPSTRSSRRPVCSPVRTGMLTTTREISTAAADEADRVRRERQRDAGSEQECADGRPNELVHQDVAALHPGVRDAQIVLRDEAGHERAAGAVGERLRRAEHEQRGEDDRDVDAGADDRPDEDEEHRGPGEVRPDDHPLPITRSATAPPGIPKSSIGRYPAVTARDTRNGSCVRDATRSGPAARTTPSPKLSTIFALTSHRKLWPSRSGTIAWGDARGQESHRPEDSNATSFRASAPDSPQLRWTARTEARSMAQKQVTCALRVRSLGALCSARLDAVAARRSGHVDGDGQFAARADRYLDAVAVAIVTVLSQGFAGYWVAARSPATGRSRVSSLRCLSVAGSDHDTSVRGGRPRRHVRGRLDLHRQLFPDDP